MLVVSICIPIFVLSLTLQVDRLCPMIDYTIFSSFRNCFFSVGFYFDSTLILWALAVKLRVCMSTCVEFFFRLS
jgi:hypothetical protein